MRLSPLPTRFLPLLALVAWPVATAAGQDFTGTFTVANQQGGTVTLVLRQAADGQLTGSMSGNGSQFQVEGMVEEGSAMGAITSGEGGVFFEATIAGDELTLSLIEVGAGNMPDYSKARTLVLRRSGAGGAAPPGNPLGGGAGAGDPFAGSFSGDGLSLELTGNAGAYRGTLTFQGQSYPAQAGARGGQLQGSFTTGGQSYPFSATVSGNQLRLESGGGTYMLTRAGGGAPANPLAGGAAPGGGVAAESGGLQGSWSCQTGTGMAQLAFVSNRELVFNGERTPYELGQGVIRVPGDFGPVEYRYQLGGDQLAVTGPDGSAMQCRRQQAGAAGGGGGMEALLQGERCAYSSSPDGGFSTLYRLYFDGEGRFLSGTESSFSGDPGIAYGLHNNPNAGTYQVTGTGRGAAIHMTWPDGSTSVATVYVGDASVIRELRLNGRHYGPGLCQ